jgi:hypothetical protein
VTVFWVLRVEEEGRGEKKRREGEEGWKEQKGGRSRRGNQN